MLILLFNVIHVQPEWPYLLQLQKEATPGLGRSHLAGRNPARAEFRPEPAPGCSKAVPALGSFGGAAFGPSQPRSDPADPEAWGEQSLAAGLKVCSERKRFQISNRVHVLKSSPGL